MEGCLKERVGRRAGWCDKCTVKLVECLMIEVVLIEEIAITAHRCRRLFRRLENERNDKEKDR